MSKEIDFSKAPEGATHYYTANEDAHFAWAKYVDGEIYISVPRYQKYWELYTDFHGEHPIKIPQQWSIYTNDKPLCELSDEQYGKMRRANDAGAIVEVKNVQANQWVCCNPCIWSRKAIYRIKQKTEREEFIDAAVKVVSYNRVWQMSREDAEHLFDSGKFQLKEQPK